MSELPPSPGSTDLSVQVRVTAIVAQLPVRRAVVEPGGRKAHAALVRAANAAGPSRPA